jgi:TolA-binding protein
MANPAETRLVDREALDRGEERIAHHLRNLLPAATLSDGTAARIRQQLGRAPSTLTRAWRLIPAAIGLLALAGAIAIALHRPAPRPQQPMITAEAARTVRLSDGVALIGPGRASVDTGALRLHEGSLTIDGAAAPVRVETPDSRITVRPGGRVTVDVRSFRSHIAAYAGSAEVEWIAIGRTVELQAGNEASVERVAPIAGSPPVERALPPAADHPVEQPPPVPVVAVAPVESARATARARRAAAEVAAAPLATAEDALNDEPDPSPTAEDPIGAESRLLREALTRIRHGDAAAALQALDDYDAHFAAGTLAPEARRARVEALLLRGDRAAALALLDGGSFGEHLPAALSVVRGELRAAAGRCGEALGDFSAASQSADPSIEERALYGAAVCHARVGLADESKAELEQYLKQFPTGKLADAARSALRLSGGAPSGH